MAATNTNHQGNALQPPSSWNAVSIGIALLMALRGLTANKLRAFLTTLGIIIGVGAVIVAIGIGEGSRAAVSASIQKMGTNVLTIIPGQMQNGPIGMGSGSSNTLTLEDSQAILAGVDSVIGICPQVQNNAQVKYKNKNTSVGVYGVTTSFPKINNHPVGKGRFFSESEDKARRRVAVIGVTTSKALFGKGADPVGKTIRVAGQNFYIVGMLKKKGGQGFRNPDEAVYVPINTAMKRLFGLKKVQNITCQARSFGVMKKCQADIETFLKKRHGIAPGADADFTVMNQADLANAQSEQQGTFTTLITCLAIVSLCVGGIGIMNIMLVSVTERTREIGVRKAIGARRRDVLAQFIIEALLLSSVGGILGVVSGIIGARVVSAMNGWAVSVQPTTILMSFSFAAAVGVFFGFYPAMKASKLKPIEALRYE